MTTDKGEPGRDAHVLVPDGDSLTPLSPTMGAAAAMATAAALLRQDESADSPALHFIAEQMDRWRRWLEEKGLA